MRTGVWNRLRPAVAALAAVIAVPVLAPGVADAGRSAQTSSLTALELSTVETINELRVSHGLAPLTVSAQLFDSTMIHCRQMVEGGYFGHESPNGSSFLSRITSYYPRGRYRYYSVGENLLWTMSPLSSQAMVERWMKSPEHRANLLDPTWRQVAVGALSVPAAPGIFGNRPVTVVTVDFGVRA